MLYKWVGWIWNIRGKNRSFSCVVSSLALVASMPPLLQHQKLSSHSAKKQTQITSSWLCIFLHTDTSYYSLLWCFKQFYHLTSSQRITWVHVKKKNMAQSSSIWNSPAVFWSCTQYMWLHQSFSSILHPVHSNHC